MLSVSDSRSRNRSRSPGRRDERSRSRDARAPSDSRESDPHRHREPGRREEPRPAEGSRHDYALPGQYKWEYDHPEERDGDRSVHDQALPARPQQTRRMSINTAAGFHVDVGHDRPPSSRQGHCPPPPLHSMSVGSGGGPQYGVMPQWQYAQPPSQITYVGGADTRKQHYASTPRAEMEIEARRTSSDKHKERHERTHDGKRDARRDAKHDTDDDDDDDDHHRHYDDRRHERPEHERRDSYHRPRVVEIHPGGSGTLPPPSPGLGQRMHRLSVSGGVSGALSLAAPTLGHRISIAAAPGSPLLEAYRGTYQSISPMPSPMALLAHHRHHHDHHRDDSDLSDMEPLEPSESESSSDGEEGRLHRRRRRRGQHPRPILKRRVSVYDPEADALALAAQLRHSSPDPGTLARILPRLGSDEVLALRAEYKKHVKVGGKGVNIAKHIKMKVAGNLGRAAYATALGRWESEAHWANFWYQQGQSRRELLIESLMGRTNAEVREIKRAFSDKRYGDSLERCMQTELRKDKFRTAVLLALEERRQDDTDPVSGAQVRDDVSDLHRALAARDGGETAMIRIVVVRSDAHLRRVMREFEARHGRSLARDVIQKSPNLVGETLSHILHGALDRPVRDALLLHQALVAVEPATTTTTITTAGFKEATRESARDRTDLLVSRLVRLHWEPRHLERVRAEYGRRYGVGGGGGLERDVADAARGRGPGFYEFCLALCGGGGV